MHHLQQNGLLDEVDAPALVQSAAQAFGRTDAQLTGGAFVPLREALNGDDAVAGREATMLDVSWLHGPLFVNAGGHGVIVGIDAERSWYVRPDDPFRADSHRGGVSLLPLMQPGYGGDLPTARRMVAEALEATGLDAALVETFPFHAPVLVAFEHMAGWTPWAIEWLAGIELPERAEPILRAAVGDKTISQSIRHRVRTFLARRNRASPDRA